MSLLTIEAQAAKSAKAAKADRILAQEARDAVDVAQEVIEEARDDTISARDEALNYGDARLFRSWSEASAATFTAGEYAMVVSTDTGTHTDPVVGGTVNNAGVFRYSSSPAGLERVGNLQGQIAQAWAEGPGEPGGPGTKSAKGWAEDAAQSAAYAGGFETPEYASQSAGNAATTAGQIFRVPKGTTPETFDWYRRSMLGTSALVSPLATTAALAAQGGAALVGIGQTDILERFRSVSVSITEFGASGISDCLAACQDALAVVSAAGGGTIVFPHQGLGGWRLSDTFVVNVDNVCVSLLDDVVLTKATAARAISFAKTGSVTLNNVALVAPNRKCTVNGNGASMSGYTYNPSGTLYPAVSFDYCNGVVCQNIHATNGLVNSLLFQFCRNHTVIDCDGSDAFYDNGISTNFALDYNGYSATDPSTWANGKFIRCRGFGNAAVGITNYGGYGIVFKDCQTWDNGQDVAGSTLPWGGGISVEANGTINRDSATTIINPVCIGNRNYDLFVSAPGVTVINPDFRNTIKPVNRTDTISAYGSSIIALGLATVSVTSGKINSPGLHGIRQLATNGNFPTVIWDGEIANAGSHGIYGQGIARLDVSRRSRINTCVGDGVFLANTGAGFNPGAGEANVSGAIQNCGTLAVNSDGVGTAVVAQVDLLNNRASTTAGSQVRIRTAVTADVSNVRNRDANAKTNKIVEIASTCTNGRAVAISGDAVTPQTAVDNSATNTIFTAAQDLGWDLILEDRAAAGTAGGDAVSGRNTRPLGTTSINRRTLATSISGGSFTLPAGTYVVTARAQAFKVNEHTLYLRNTTAGTDIAQGTSEFADAATNAVSNSVLEGVFTLTAASALSLEHYCQTARATDGLGKAMTTQPGRFAWLGVRKVT